MSRPNGGKLTAKPRENFEEAIERQTKNEAYQKNRQLLTDVLSAAQEGRLEALEAAVAALGADSGATLVEAAVSCRDGRSRNALHFAATGGAAASGCVAYLVGLALTLEPAARAEFVDAEDDEGDTPLALVAKFGGGAAAVAELVSKGGAAVDRPSSSASSQRGTALHQAAMGDHVETIGALLDAHASVDAASDIGTPLQFGVMNGAAGTYNV